MKMPSSPLASSMERLVNAMADDRGMATQTLPGANPALPGFLAEAEVLDELPAHVRHVPVVKVGSDAMPSGYTWGPRALRCEAEMCLHQEHVTSWISPEGRSICPFAAHTGTWWVTSSVEWVPPPRFKKAAALKAKFKTTESLLLSGGPWNGGTVRYATKLNKELVVWKPKDVIFVIGTPENNVLAYEPSPENRRHPLLGFYWFDHNTNTYEWGTSATPPVVPEGTAPR